SPGSYSFRLKVTTAGMQESATALDISVLPAFYQTQLFYYVCALAGALLIWAVWQLRLRAIRQRFSIALAERTRIAGEIHDTLLQSMAGLALHVEGIAKDLQVAPHSVAEELRGVRRQVEREIAEARYAIWYLRTPTLETRTLASALKEVGARLLKN